jgi:ectoine hydroxylase-related dioxygenase (phytanoyl-CoA dioxygenase family)
MISEDQKRAFAEYGFLVLEDFLTGDEVRESALACDELGRQAADWEFSKEDFNLEAPVGRVQGQDGKRRSYTGVIRAVHYIEQHSPWFAELPHRKRLEEDVIQSLLDTQSTHYLSGIHCNKPARVGSGQPWHQDFGYVSEDVLRQLSDAMTIWIAIGPATRENGCLQFRSEAHGSSTLSTS